MLILKSDKNNVYVRTGDGTTAMQLLTDSMYITKSTMRLMREQLGDECADIYIRILELLLEEEKANSRNKAIYRMDEKELIVQLNELRKIKHERDLEENNGVE